MARLFTATVNFKINLLCGEKPSTQSFFVDLHTMCNAHGRQDKTTKNQTSFLEYIWTFVYSHIHIYRLTEFLVTKVAAVMAAKRYRKKRARQNIITNNINWLILNWKWNLLIIFHSKCLLTKCNAFTIPLSVCASANWLIDILTQQRVHRGNEWKIVWTQNSDGH